MLVLSRKLDQQISIGDDIVLTVVRIDSHRVRIGIDAPKDIRILRGELAADQPAEEVLSEREFAFAHPQPERAKSPKNRLPESDRHQLFEGKVDAAGATVELRPAPTGAAKRAPLAQFVSAT